MDVLKWVIVGVAALVSVVLVVLLLPTGESSYPVKETATQLGQPQSEIPSQRPPENPAQTPPTAPGPDEAFQTELAVLVNGQPITREAFEQAYVELVDNYTRFYQQFGQDFAERLQGQAGAYYQLELRSQLVDSLVRDALIAAEIKKRAITFTEAELEAAFQAQFAEIMTQNDLTEAQADEILKQQDSSLAQFKQELRQQIANTLKQEQLMEQVTGQISVLDNSLLVFVSENKLAYMESLVAVDDPSDEQALTYYNEHQDEFTEVRARHILIQLDENASALEVSAAEARIHDVKRRLDEGEDFSQLATEVSEDPGSGANGGDLGYFGRGRMVEAFEEVAFSLPPGQVSDPVRTQFGLHLILVEDRRVLPFEQVADQARAALVEGLMDEAFDALLAQGRRGDARVMAQLKAAAEADFIEQRRGELFETWVDVITEQASIQVQLPLVAAHRLEATDLDGAIAAYETLQAQGTPDDPNLGYYLCQLYPRRFEAASQRIDALQAQDELTSEQSQELDTLLQRVELYEARAQLCGAP